MQQGSTFSSALDAVDQLSLEEQETLAEILRRRLAERRRREIVREVEEARREFAQGQCQPAEPSEIMDEILS